MVFVIFLDTLHDGKKIKRIFDHSSAFALHAPIIYIIYIA